MENNKLYKAKDATLSALTCTWEDKGNIWQMQ